MAVALLLMAVAAGRTVFASSEAAPSKPWQWGWTFFRQTVASRTV